MRWCIPQWHQATSSSTRARVICNTHSFQYKTATVAVLNSIDFFGGLGSIVEFRELRIAAKAKGFRFCFYENRPFRFFSTAEINDSNQLKQDARWVASPLLLAELLCFESISCSNPFCWNNKQELESILPIWYRNKSAICCRSIFDWPTDTENDIENEAQFRRERPRNLCLHQRLCRMQVFKLRQLFHRMACECGMFVLAKYLRRLPFVDYSKTVSSETMCMCTHGHNVDASRLEQRNVCRHSKKSVWQFCRSARALVHTPSTLYTEIYSSNELPNVLSSGTIFIRLRRFVVRRSAQARVLY